MIFSLQGVLYDHESLEEQQLQSSDVPHSAPATLPSIAFPFTGPSAHLLLHGLSSTPTAVTLYFGFTGCDLV